MPDLSLTPEQELLRNAARDFIVRECPLSLVRQVEDEEGGFSRELWETVRSVGWLALLVHQEYGGSGGTLTDAAVLYEELGRGLLPVPLHTSAVLSTLIVQAIGTEQEKRRLLPAIASGERIAALAFTEAGSGWDAERVHTTATARKGRYVLNGAKRFVVDGGTSNDLIVAAREGGGVGLFLVDDEQSGVSWTELSGFTGVPLYDIELERAQATRLGGDATWEDVAPALDAATAVLCAHMAGACRRVYEMSIDYAERRVQFGQAIARFQRVQDHLIEMLNDADAARWTAYEAVWKLDNGKPNAAAAVSVAKAVASEAFYRACEAAHHVHGGIGSDKAYGLYLYTERSRTLYHHLGDTAWHRERLARELGL